MKQRKQVELVSFASALGSDELPHMKGLGRRERKAAQTRLKLFRSAIQLFAKDGFPNVTVEQITEAADVGKGTFFNYFKSKDHVLSVIAEIQLGKVREAVQLAESGKQPIRSVLHNLFIAITEEPGRSPELARALLTAFLSSTIREFLARNMADGRGIIAKILELGQERGEIGGAWKAEEIALQFQQSLLGTMLLWSLKGEPRLRLAVETSFRQFWRAIAVENNS